MSQPGRPRLYLIDGYALIFRAFHALSSVAPLRNARGENTGMAKGVSEFIRRLIEKHKPEYLGWVSDAGSSGREELLEERIHLGDAAGLVHACIVGTAPTRPCRRGAR